jgi:hypothetical protein
MKVFIGFLDRLKKEVICQAVDLPLSYCYISFTPPKQQGLILMLPQLKLPAFLAILLVSTGYKY